MSEYIMDYIKDQNLFKAVMFARRMMQNGTPVGLAEYKAARYYRVNVEDVKFYVSQTGGRVNGIKQNRRKRNKRKEEQND